MEKGREGGAEGLCGRRRGEGREDEAFRHGGTTVRGQHQHGTVSVRKPHGEEPRDSRRKPSRTPLFCWGASFMMHLIKVYVSSYLANATWSQQR